MNKTYGTFTNNKGEYVLNKIPEAGNFEYIYKNKIIFLKVDQFGPSLAQYNPPVGMKVIKRKEREPFSPWNIYFEVNGKVFNNFDIYHAKKFEIRFSNSHATYSLSFGTFDVITTIFVNNDEPELYMNVEFVNKKEIPTKIKVLSTATLDPIDTSMAEWDKKDWYMRTTFDGELSNPNFVINHYSVNAFKKDRKNISVTFLGDYQSAELSYEKLVSKTRNFNKLPNNLTAKEKAETYSVEQTVAAIKEIEVKEKLTFSSIIHIYEDDETIDKKKIINKINKDYFEKQLDLINKTFLKHTEVQNITTKDVNFNKFVNEFLPQEIYWVTDLDRGWSTGMRGARDCANDFMGFIPYEQKTVRDVIIRLISNQRFNDGWFPRQIPFGDSNKYDLREFVDSGAFVIELIYEYLCFTNDWNLLEEEFPYYQNETKEKGVIHLIKAAKFYTLEENIGEHGLIKLKGGDWLDCLNRVGLLGRGETLMVTCQAVLAFLQVNEVLAKYGNQYSEEISLFNKYTTVFKKNINKHCLTDEGFYQALFSDDGNWYFSPKDVDGEKRVYVPSNAYAIIADINKGKNKAIIKAIKENNRTNRGYRLFSKPFGVKPIEGLGKMGTGDFLPNALENGAIYNHGSQLFFIRALAKAGDYKTLYEVLNFAIPYNQKFHPESEACLPMYAVTNVYNLAPYFEGRAGMCFLTGSIAMIIRAIYHWMFGINFHVDYLEINPCLPKQYESSIVNFLYEGKEIKIHYHGFGNKVEEAKFNGKDIEIKDSHAFINKSLINNGGEFEITLK